MEKYAMIDLGSNTVRLVIFEVYKSGAYKLVESLSDTVRLSHGMKKNGLLSEGSMKKASDTIKVFADFCDSYNVPRKNISAFATAAVRLAKNGGEFITGISKKHDIGFRILSGEEEALYVFNAVNKTFDLKRGVIIDIGGGSTEIISYEDHKVLGYISIPYGCVSATEIFLEDGSPPSQKNIEILEQALRSKLEELDWIKKSRGFEIIGIGGTTRTVAKINMQETRYPFNRINSYSIPSLVVYSLEARISRSTEKELKKIPGLSSDRMDVICAGLVILKTICSFIDSKRIIFSGSGLREGVFLDRMFNEKMLPEFDGALDFSLNNFMLLYNIRQTHARHVTKLSLKLFRQLSSLHGFERDMERYLNTAAMIHDSGIYISYYNHNRHSLYLIMNSSIYGLDHREQILVAIAASGLSDKKLRIELQGNYSLVLDKESLRAAKVLALIIRIAEALDKSETGTIEDIDCEISRSRVKLITKKVKDASIELRSTEEYADDFKKIFKKNIEVI